MLPMNIIMVLRRLSQVSFWHNYLVAAKNPAGYLEDQNTEETLKQARQNLIENLSKCQDMTDTQIHWLKHHIWPIKLQQWSHQ